MLWRGFQKPKRLAVDTETLTEKYGKFSAQPFERGFGTTIGNALRRTLLSSIEGAAVTAVKIEGVLHEFQSITGVVEDATDIILNLKQIPFKLNGEGPKALYLRADQPGVVTSGMIEADGDVEILDKDVYVATVSEGGKLDMEMRLKRGRGYVSADKNFDSDLGIGFIPVDSVHSPVRKVNYTVDAARLGQITDYDKLTIEVWTNRSVLPADSPWFPLLRERAAAVRPQLLEVAAALERAPDPPPEVMQTLRRLLTDGCTSPLWNEDVPAGELAATLEQARAELNWAELGDRGGPVVPLPTARPLSVRAQRLRAGATPHAWHHITRDVGGR